MIPVVLQLTRHLLFSGREPVRQEHYPNILLDVIDVLEIPFVFVHSDEMANSKLCDIWWKNKDIYFY